MRTAWLWGITGVVVATLGLVAAQGYEGSL